MITSFDNDDFIDEVKKHPQLWDPNNSGFRCRKTKEAAWMAVSSTCLPHFENYTEAEKEELCRKLANKWRAIRDNYVRYLKHVKVNQNKTYKYAKKLSFLTAKCSDDDSDEEQSSSSRRRSSYDEDYVAPKRRKKNASPLFVSKEEPIDQDEYEVELEAAPEVSVPEAIYLDKNDSADEDRSFFESLLPACKTLDLDQKLHFRSQVINLLRHIRKGNDNVRLDPTNGMFVSGN